MKTLILNGSPKENGDIAALIREIEKHLKGEIVTLSCRDAISPCIDCRYCWEHPGCAVQDKMQGIYPYFEPCDNVILASPIWFSQLSGVLLNLASRLVQTYFAAGYFRKEPTPIKKKNSVLVFAGAEKGTESGARRTAKTILKFMNALPITAEVSSMNTNEVPASVDAEALYQAREAAQLLNRAYESECIPQGESE